MNFWNFLLGLGLLMMGIYTFNVSSWDLISVVIGAAQLVAGIYLIWTAFRRERVVAVPIPGVYQ